MHKEAIVEVQKGGGMVWNRITMVVVAGGVKCVVLMTNFGDSFERIH